MKFSIQRTSPGDRTDEELVRRLQAGESGALDELYRRYAPLLMRYFYRMLWQDRTKAQDAVHDVFTKVIEKPDRVDAARSFSTWLFSVAHNLCKNAYRSHAVRKSALNGHSVNTAENPQAGAGMDHTEFKKSLDRLLLEEGEEARAIVVFRFDLEMSYTEIGAALGLPEGTVKSKLFHLKKRLAQQLEPFKSIIEK